LTNSADVYELPLWCESKELKCLAQLSITNHFCNGDAIPTAIDCVYHNIRILDVLEFRSDIGGDVGQNKIAKRDD
jgi:hypothetical protein